MFRRFVIGPIARQLTQGASPEQIARTLAVGTACSVLPFLGLTSLLNLGVGWALRMNQPLLQALNQLLGPVQLALIFVYVRIGEALWGQRGGGFSVTTMLRVFREETFGAFLREFGWAGVHALTAWLVTAPILAAAVYFSARPLVWRVSRLMRP